MKLYHVNNTPNLRRLTPRKPVTSHDAKLKDRPILYLSSSRAYAAAFSFPWTSAEVDLSSYDGGRSWTLTLPAQMRRLVEERRPVSLYTVEVEPTGVVSRVKGVPEYVSGDVLETQSEERYQTAKDCMEQNGLNIQYLGEGNNPLPSMETWYEW